MSTEKTYDYLIKQAKKHQPVFVDLLKTQGILVFPKKKNMPLFDYVAKTIVGQQLSLRAAKTIWERLFNLSESQKVLLIDYLIEQELDVIKTAGVSTNKAKALKSLAVEFKDERIKDNHLKKCTHAERSEILIACWGIGQWTCDMVSMFYYQEPDIWPKTDGGVMSAVRKVTGNPDLKPDETDVLVEPFAPHRSLLAFYLWESLNNKIL